MEPKPRSACAVARAGAVMCFPAAMKRALEKEAKAEGKSTGAYARGILADGLMAIA